MWLSMLLLFACDQPPALKAPEVVGGVEEAKLFEPRKVIPYVVPVDAPMAKLSTKLDTKSVLEAANLVADWQIRHVDSFLSSPLKNFQGIERYSFGGWLMGTMAIGMTQWGRVPGNERYLEFVRKQSSAFEWQVERRLFDADDYTIGQTYLELFDVDGDEDYIVPLKARLDLIYEKLPDVYETLGEKCKILQHTCRERWSWIDALFMAAPVWVHMAKVTGDKRYLGFADHEFWTTFDTLWDESERLLYRDSRFPATRDENGDKVFWSRGNGWVFASFARLLPKLPKSHASHSRYIEKFTAMASRLAELQRPDGSWGPSLTNPLLFPMPENSGSAFFTYGLAWGINQGLLDPEIYLPVVSSAWGNLVENIYADGRLGFIQPSGAAPQNVHKESTDVYGVGAFLLAASELLELASISQGMADSGRN